MFLVSIDIDIDDSDSDSDDADTDTDDNVDDTAGLSDDSDASDSSSVEASSDYGGDEERGALSEGSTGLSIMEDMIHRFRRVQDADGNTMTNPALFFGDEPSQWTHTSGTFPFPDMQTMVLLAFLQGDDDIIWVRMLKKILYLVFLQVELAGKAIQEGKEFRLPAPDHLLNFWQRKKTVIPTFETEEVEVTNKDAKKVKLYMNLPSSHLRFLVSNPLKDHLLSPLPDFTPDQLDSFQQGEKWRRHELFQQPVMKVRDTQYWVGDVAVLDAPSSVHGVIKAGLLIKSFFTSNGATYADGVYGVLVHQRWC